MSLAGLGVVAIWHDLRPEIRADFDEWHNREHMPERVGIPGFRRGRRFVARRGAPEFFVLYEADSIEVLSGQDYFARLNSPTPWTRSVVSRGFLNASRAICRVVWSQGIGQGGFALTLRFGAATEREEALRRHLTQIVLPRLVDLRAVAGVHLCIADKAGSRVETAEAKGREVAVPDWLVVVEGSSPEGCETALARLLGDGGLVPHGALPGHEDGLYQLEFSRTKTPWTTG